ncbi:DUF7373 family lipoprotein [Mycolicibacterium phocaicum]|uniref:DUF7373 family lipoprotein n=1 Tax=Mycolicibacterium phocaicum TaxID=319706 RepID=UPI001CFA9D5E|nr:hypothetical protein [Mycolicibacterium phocaicum]UCZ60739.1 hypothetical protein LHJ73_00355 [Mycolicibacterium phocaicum]
MALLAGCTTVTTGDAAKDPSFKSGDAIVSLLNPGNYPTTPKPGPAMKPGAESGRLIDAERLAEFVVGPWEVDPTLISISVATTGVYLQADGLVSVEPGPMAQIAKDHQLINGFGSARGTVRGADHDNGMLILVLRFPTPDLANDAARQFSAQAPTVDRATPKQPTSIPGHPEALAHESTMFDGKVAVTSYTPHGPYVLYQFASSYGSIDTARQLITKALDLQSPRIDKFRPTDPAQFATMQLDPDGLLPRTVPTKEHILFQGLWGAHGFLHLEDDPIRAAAAWTTAGVDVISVRGTRLYRAKDADAATQLARKFAEPDGTNPTEPGPTVPGLPMAKCQAVNNTDVKARIYECSASLDRWVYAASSLQPFDATQRMASQYLLLTAK